MKIYAHRGYSEKYPENTMLAFQKAVEFGADGIETDVHQTKDGILVLCHDESIDRTSDGYGQIKDMTYEELLKYDFGKYSYLNLSIPRLDELLALAKETGIELNIEIKTDHYHYEGIEKKVLDMINDYGILDQVMFSSFCLDSLLILRKLDPNVRIGYLFEDDFEEHVTLAKQAHCDYIHPEYVFLDDAMMQRFNLENIGINAWTINEREDMEFFLAHGLRGCITNCVELGVQVKKDAIR